MAIFKCKMCGGDLNVTEETKIIECDYCGTTQTVPAANNEKKVNLFNRATRLRINGEFDKAAGIYENIIAEFPEEAEAYWGLCLCNYGIEYVDDPATAKKIPTCHRASFEKLSADENYNLAMEYADVIAQKLYRDEAREIDRIMGEILSISKSEKPYDVFICYKETDEKGSRTIDSVIAQDIYDVLTSRGMKVFFARISLEDKLGQMYEPYIFAALNSAKVFLSIGTKYEYFHAVWVKNEWSRFLKLMAKDKSKVLIPCYRDMDAYDLPDEFKALQAQDMNKIGFMQDLVRGIEKIMPRNGTAFDGNAQQNSANASVESLLKRAFIFLEDEDFKSADEYCEKVLDIDPENALAYLGKLMAEFGVSKHEDLKDLDEPFENSNNYLKIMRYGNDGLVKMLMNYSSVVNTSVEKARAEAEENARIREEEEARIRRFNTERLAPIRRRIRPAKNHISAGGVTTVGLRSNGTAVALGKSDLGRCDVNRWNNIISVSAGFSHTIGLTANGTVVSTKLPNDYEDNYDQCNVSGWNNISAVSAGWYHTVGLRADGTVISTTMPKDSEYYVGQCNVSGWTNMVAVAAGGVHTVGLRSDGTVVAVGDNEFGQRNVSSWRNIVAIATNLSHTVGLRADGTVVATKIEDDPDYDYGQGDVDDWTDIIDIATGWYHTVGLKADGTVVAVGLNDEGQCDLENWRGIIAVSAGFKHTIGLRADGTIVSSKITDDYNYDHGQCDVEQIRLFSSVDTLSQERTAYMANARAASQQRAAFRNQWRNAGRCQHCGGEFKGLFAKKCTACGKMKDY